MFNDEDVKSIGKSVLILINEIQYKLKLLRENSSEEKYLVLTELYSLRTRVYILINEPQFFKLDQDILLSKLICIFENLKKDIKKSDSLSQLKKLVFLMSTLVSSIGIGDSSLILSIVDKISEL